jgi:hypothetical protein
LAHRQRESLLGFFPREDAHFGFRGQHGALHRDRVRVRGDLVPAGPGRDCGNYAGNRAGWRRATRP